MLNIVFSEKANEFLKILDLNILEDISEMIQYIPKNDIVGIDKVYFRDTPLLASNVSQNTIASYHQSYNNKQALVEIYLARIITFTNNSKLVSLLYPIIKYQIAQAIFHEIGHHIEKTKSHGIKKHKSENFAISYSNNLLNLYVSNILESLKLCFTKLNELAEKNEQLSKILNHFIADLKKRKTISR